MTTVARAPRWIPAGATPVSWDQVHAFRLGRHFLQQRAPKADLAKVLSQIGGAQAQLLAAAEESLWARVEGLTSSNVEEALWRTRSLVRAWCMRRTLYLLPAEEVALFVRGSARRAEKEVRWMRNHGVSETTVDSLIASVLGALGKPSTRTEIAEDVARSMGGEVRYRPGGGGWGNRRKEPWVRIGRSAWPVVYLLHVAGARGVVCSGPARGGEATYVRGDRWVRHWADRPGPAAEEELLRRYLGAFGPATPADFALWSGVRLRDAHEIWARLESELARVDLAGWGTWVLRRDLATLQEARPDGPVARLLPHFDAYLLAHEERSHLVARGHQQKVYRSQGWISPVLLHGGEVVGVWSHERTGRNLTVRLEPFGHLDRSTRTALEREGRDLRRFFAADRVSVTTREPSGAGLTD